MSSDKHYIQNLEKDVEKLQLSNKVIREFVDYIVKDVNTNDDMIKRISISLITIPMILDWLESNELWVFDSKVCDAQFERKIYVSNTKQNQKRISVITKVVGDASNKSVQDTMNTSVFEAFNEILANAESSGAGKIKVIVGIILGK
jgi:hypothetical protein